MCAAILVMANGTDDDANGNGESGTGFVKSMPNRCGDTTVDFPWTVVAVGPTRGVGTVKAIVDCIGTNDSVAIVPSKHTESTIMAL